MYYNYKNVSEVFMKKILLLVSTCIILFGCESYAIKDGKKISLTEPTSEGYTQILEGWENASEAHLIERWGVPTQTYEVNGKKYLLYKDESYLTFNGNSYHFYCDTTFTVENGKIVFWKYSGNKCKAIYKETN